jgi:dTDP-4-amino-4,6-dideoxygalactose transaminase
MPMLGLGLHPLFCDADPRTANVTIESVKHAISCGAEAIVVTHMWGLPCDVAQIRNLAEARGLKIIEDASHAPGAEINSVKAGALGDLAAISFQAFKLIWAGEGGVLLTDDDELYSRAVVFGHNQRRIVELGADNPYAGYAPLGYGLKLRIHPLGAVIATHALQQLPEIIERQRSSAFVLDAALRDSHLAEPPVTTASTRRVYYTYKPLLRNAQTVEKTREAIVSYLQERGIPARIPDSGLLSDHPIFRDGRGDLFGLDLKPERQEFPGARHFFRRAITIPFPNTGVENEIQEVADAMKSAFEGAHPKIC